MHLIIVSVKLAYYDKLLKHVVSRDFILCMGPVTCASLPDCSVGQQCDLRTFNPVSLHKISWP